MRRRIAPFLLCMLAAAAGCDLVQEGPSPEADRVEVEMAIWESAFGREAFFEVADKFEKHCAEQGRNVQVNVLISPTIDNLIKPSILRGDPPEIINSGGSIRATDLLKNGKIYFLDDALDAPAYPYDDPSPTWRETFLPGALDTFQYEGKTSAVPFCYLIWGVFYDAKLFREHGWEPPATWEEMLALCEEIEATTDIAPFGYQGREPGYGYWFLMSILQRVGGLRTLYAVNNVEPGCFTDPAFIEAARMLQDLAGKHFQSGARAMDRMEAQIQLMNRDCAMLYNGNWLLNETRETIPEDFELSMFGVPAVADGLGDPNVHASQFGGTTGVMADADYPEVGVELLKFWLSKETMQDFTEKTNSISPVVGGTKTETLSPAERSVMDVVQATTGTFTDRLLGLYPRWRDVDAIPALEKLLWGEITPEEFGRILETTADEKIRNNEDVYRPPPWRMPEAKQSAGQ